MISYFVYKGSDPVDVSEVYIGRRGHFKEEIHSVLRYCCRLEDRLEHVEYSQWNSISRK